MRLLASCVLAAGLAACRAEPGSTPVGTAPSVMVTVAPATAAGPGPAGVPTLEIPRQAAQVGIRLLGELGELEHLTAEMAPAAAPDEVRRWRVDAAPEAGDGAKAMVTLPPHAVPDGDYLLTIWEGDARVVARYGFRTVKR